MYVCCLYVYPDYLLYLPRFTFTFDKRLIFHKHFLKPRQSQGDGYDGTLATSRADRFVVNTFEMCSKHTINWFLEYI